MWWAYVCQASSPNNCGTSDARLAAGAKAPAAKRARGPQDVGCSKPKAPSFTAIKRAKSALGIGSRSTARSAQLRAVREFISHTSAAIEKRHQRQTEGKREIRGQYIYLTYCHPRTYHRTRRRDVCASGRAFRGVGFFSGGLRAHQAIRRSPVVDRCVSAGECLPAGYPLPAHSRIRASRGPDPACLGRSYRIVGPC